MPRLEPSSGRAPAVVFAALGDPTRLSLLTALSGGEERSISRLAGEARSDAGIAVSRQALTKHLTVLKRAGLVSCRKAGRESRFRICVEALEPARDYLELVSRQWDDALGRLKAFAERPQV